MKTVIVLIVSAIGFCLAGCVEQPLMSDEDYYRTHGPAPYSPDFSGVIPQRSTRPGGY